MAESTKQEIAQISKYTDKCSLQKYVFSNESDKDETSNAENVIASFITDAVNSRPIKFNFDYHSKHEAINVKTASKFRKMFKMH